MIGPELLPLLAAPLSAFAYYFFVWEEEVEWPMGEVPEGWRPW